MTSIHSTGRRLLVLLQLLLVPPLALSQANDQVERRVQSVATLIEASSAARQIESSGVVAARERRDNAAVDSAPYG